MHYYVEVPFGAGDERPNSAVGDDMVRVNGVTFLRISGRQFERITKAFRARGWSHQLTALKDSAEGNEAEVLATVLMAGHSAFPGLIYSAG